MTAPEKSPKPTIIITPTIGRKVWYWHHPNCVLIALGENSFPLSHNKEKPFDATVLYVQPNGDVNLAISDHNGNQFAAHGIRLLQEGEFGRAGEAHAQWMPYQAGQAKKAAAEEIAPLPYRQTSHVEDLERDLVAGAAQAIADNPSRGRPIAEGIRAALDVLYPSVAVPPGLAVESAASIVHRKYEESLESEIQAKADNAPRVTPQALQDEIVNVHYFNGADAAFGAEAAHAPENDMSPLQLMTFCVLELRNGYTVHGVSACASPENYNAEIGRRIARENAERQVWPLLGFRLRDKLAGA